MGFFPVYIWKISKYSTEIPALGGFWDLKKKTLHENPPPKITEWDTVVWSDYKFYMQKLCFFSTHICI